MHLTMDVLGIDRIKQWKTTRTDTVRPFKWASIMRRCLFNTKPALLDRVLYVLITHA